MVTVESSSAINRLVPRSLERGDAEPARPRATAARRETHVAIAHGDPIIAAGLGSLIRDHTDWPVVHLDARASIPWDGLVGKHIVLADEAIVVRAMRTQDPTVGRPAWSRLVLVSRERTATPSRGRRAPADATIGTDCSSHDLLDVVGALVTQLQADDDPTDAGGGRTGPGVGDVHDSATRSGAAPAARKGGLAPNALRRVRDHIAAHYAESIDVRELAAIARLSPHHFARAFKQSLGLPPHRYVLLRRICAAADLARDTDRSFAEIGATVGFSDQSHFCRAFTAMTGERPSAFRRMHR